MDTIEQEQINTLMQQFPEFCEPYGDINIHTMDQGFHLHHPQEEFYGTNNNNNNNIRSTMPLADLIDNNNPWSSSFTQYLPSSTISFSNNNNNNPTPIMLQEQDQHHQISEGTNVNENPYGEKRNSVAAMREMIFRMAAMQPIHIDPESVKAPKRRNVKISKDPQSVAARHRRERISERIRILQRLVPGGTKMDTASMLDEAIHYVKFLKTQVQSLERASANNIRPLGLGVVNGAGIGFPVPMSKTSDAASTSNNPYFPLHKPYGDAS